MEEAEVDKRLEQVLDEQDPELLWDMRKQNSGRHTEYDEFLNRCKEYIASSVETAVDERRHDSIADDEVIVHLATALSVRDLHEQVSSRCPEGTKIPGIQWLRMQFWPRRPTAKTAARYTGKLKVKYMVQARQFRADHVDCHYASALFRYEKECAIMFRDHVTLVSMDDKHTIKVGEPGCPVAAAERGKQVLVAMGKKLAVADHDFTRLSLTPSVNLFIDVPEKIDESFHRGQVCISFKENAFQPSTPVRHVTELHSELTDMNLDGKPILMLYTDGGPDHRVTYMSVQLSIISLFLSLDLDYVCAVRTPPKHSWKNPVERIMSIINLGLQGVGIMRKEIENENKLTSCGGLKSVREMAEKVPELKDEVLGAVQPSIKLLRNLMERLKLKDLRFKTYDPASDDAIDDMWRKILQVKCTHFVSNNNILCQVFLI
ncbi:uncharacterized protein LOC117100862 [Anneissia japonica]|uniref:uncharacterized protein LOC117100862 n=1 Tax=Anneissia japonica TaxID=1529436 RepID=UPI001425B46C|nr:uncharacterized protein LOC117100862 [Anneissia japonica]